MAGEVAFRELVKYAVGGGWGNEDASPDTVAVCVIRGTDFQNIASGSLEKVPRRFEARTKAERRFLRPNDIVLEISGGSRTSNQSTGRTLLVTDRVLGRLGGAVIPASFCRLVRFDEELVYPRFGYYALQEMYRSGRAALYEHHSTGISNFQFEYFLDQERLLLPELPEQRAIAYILGTLDDKIELNRRMSETLEEMARALFKSWFVDFDPVRAKIEGRDTGLPQHIADLFPSRIVDSELGKVPDGWGVRTLEQVCTTVMRGVTPKYEPGSKRYIINQRVNRGRYLDLTELKELDRSLEVPAACYARRWDVLVNCLGEGTLGRVHLFRGSSNEYAVDQHMSICRGLTPGSGVYLYQTLSSPAGQEKIESLKTGSTGMTMFNISKLRSFDLLWPGDDLVQAYFTVIGPELTRVAANANNSLALGSVRDTLLPRLISGELRVKDIGSFLARTAP